MPNDALATLVRLLKETDVPHMITGSFASTYHGVSRTTLDVDVVIDPTRFSLSRLLVLLAENGFYVSEANAGVAFRARGQFNVIHMESVWKIDLIIRKNRPFSETEFRPREPVTILGVDTFVTSAEDIILAKLEWAKASESSKQLRDIRGIIEIKGDTLDLAYIEKWAKALGVYGTWSRLSR